MPEHTISENLARLQQAKSDIASAITAKGGTVNSGDGLEEFPDDIRTIPSGGDSHFAANLIVTTEPGAVVTATRVSIQLNVKADSGAPITITDGFTTLTGTGTGDWQAFWLPNGGTWTGNDGGAININIRITDTIPQSIDFTKISWYGVTWSGGSETTFARTGAASNFDAPNPYYSGNTSYGSPFDDIYPWSEMKIVEKDGNSLIEIPKFYYKIERDGDSMSFQISQYDLVGFEVSPAHQDRGDGAGERDFVYIGRYHCASDYKSKTGVTPVSSITKTNAKTNVQNLGTGYYLIDYALSWTIRMLYLVEFADWDSQKVIGYGCGRTSTSAMGYTDSMPYHTGTTASNRTTYGANTQYRYIEGLWDNVSDFCDGIRFSGSTVYVYTNPFTYNDSFGGTPVGTKATTSNEIKSFFTPSVSSLDWAMYPDSVYSDSNYTTYVADKYTYGSSGTVLMVGGNRGNRNRGGGIFYLYEIGSTSYNNYSGARIMYLPSNNS